LSVNVCPGLSVVGQADPVNVNPVPVAVTELIVTVAVPVETRVTVCVAGVFKATLPKVMPVALMLKVDSAALSWTATVFDTLLAVAVNVAV
jgi:hypothetical protein